MTSSKIEWNGTSGNFTDTAHWMGGVAPGTNNTADFLNGGAAYTVTVNSAVDVHSIDVHNTLCTLSETSGGSITADSFHIEQGTAILNEANVFGVTDMLGGVIEMGDAHALGTKIILNTSGSIITEISMELHNEVGLDSGGSIAAATGTTLKLAGTLAINTSDRFVLGGADATGTIDLVGAGLAFAATDYHAELAGGRVATVAGKSAGAEAILNGASHVTLDAGASLDLGNFAGAMTLHDLDGGGTLRNTGSTSTIHLTDANFAGKLLGSLNIAAEGTNTFSGKLDNTAFTMGSGTNTLDLTNATGTFFVTGSSGSSTVVVDKVGGVYENFQAGHLTIDTKFSFANDSVTYETGPGTSLIADIHTHTGVVARHLTFEGITTSDGISVTNDGHGNMEFTWSPAETGAHAIHDVLHDAWSHHDIGIQPVVHDPWAAHDFI